MGVVIEGDITHLELLGAVVVVVVMTGVFLIEGDGAGITGGLEFGRVG